MEESCLRRALRLCCHPRFPGSGAAYEALLEVVDVDLLAGGMVWLAHNPHKCNTSYNISNGDVFRWRAICCRRRPPTPSALRSSSGCPGPSSPFKAVPTLEDGDDRDGCFADLDRPRKNRQNRRA